MPSRSVAASSSIERPGETGVHPVDQVHHRSSGALVEKRVGVESCDRSVDQLVAQGFGRSGRAEAGIDPAVERHDQDGVEPGRARDNRS